jgi:hypothetical protein
MPDSNVGLRILLIGKNAALVGVKELTAATARQESRNVLATTRAIPLPRWPADEILEESERLALARCHQPTEDR